MASTTNGILRARGSLNGVSGVNPPMASPARLSKYIVVDDASVASGTIVAGAVLPAGAIVVGIQTVESVTGGTSPTINIGLNYRDGTTDDPDALASNLSVNGNQAVTVATAAAGASFGVPLVADADITVGDGTGTPGTGGVAIIIDYTLDDRTAEA